MSAGEIKLHIAGEEVVPETGAVPINRGRWTKREKRIFEQGFEKYGKEWKLIASLIKTRTVIQIRTHAQKYFQKLAKMTNTPVMSTSKKERVVEWNESPTTPPVSPQVLQFDDVMPNKMTLRKRTKRPLHKTDINETASKRLHVGENRYRFDSFENVAGSEDDSDFPDDNDLVARELKFYSGDLSPSVIAAATLLLAPKLTGKICRKRVKWAKNFLSQTSC